MELWGRQNVSTLNLLQQTWKVRLFGLVRIPLVSFCWPRVTAMTDERCEVVIPLSWRTKNHLGSMYFGALSIGADLAAGAYAMWRIDESGGKVGLVFKDFKASFLKRPTADVVFVCTDARKIDEQIKAALATGDRITETIKITAYENRNRSEPVAEFELGLSLKKRG
jgi:acyl-coenzyme A thioesterase PaaI-like protein